MTITFVTDNFNTLSNGTVISALRFKEELERQGHTVRVVAIDVLGEGMFPLKERRIPIVSYFARKQNLTFAKPDKAVLERAFDGADIVHFFMPFKLARVGLKVAKKMGIPATAGFHVPPEHITYGIGMGSMPLFANLLYLRFRRFFKHFDNIHCPSEMVAKALRRHKYRSSMHVISNGVVDVFHYDETVERSSDTFHILSSGRFAPEKRHDLIIKAIAKSKYKDKIILHLAGRGPLESKNKQLAERLNVRTEFGFYSKEQLLEKIQQSHLYVHASEVEAEGISCIEAFSCGRVPIICDSKRAATGQFALNEDCLFKKGNSTDLAKKIDALLSNEDYRLDLEKQYAAQGQMFKIEHSVQKTVEMFSQAIKDKKTKTVHEKHPKGKWMKRHIRTKNPLTAFLSFIVYYGFVCPVLFAYNKLFNGLKIKNRHHLKGLGKTGAVTISNHVHYMDVSMNSLAVFPKKILFTSHRRNFHIPVAGMFVKAFGAVPVPLTGVEQSVFFYELSKKIQNNQFVHFYPEGELELYYDGIREFKRGAFRLAVMTGVPVLPLVLTYRERKTRKDGTKRKPRFTITIGEPIYPDKLLLSRDAEEKLMLEAEERLNLMYQEHSYGNTLETTEISRNEN